MVCLSLMQEGTPVIKSFSRPIRIPPRTSAHFQASDTEESNKYHVSKSLPANFNNCELNGTVNK